MVLYKDEIQHQTIQNHGKSLAFQEDLSEEYALVCHNLQEVMPEQKPCHTISSETLYWQIININSSKFCVLLVYTELPAVYFVVIVCFFNKLSYLNLKKIFV